MDKKFMKYVKKKNRDRILAKKMHVGRSLANLLLKKSFVPFFFLNNRLVFKGLCVVVTLMDLKKKNGLKKRRSIERKKKK